MGHVILVAEELVKFFARCPSDLAEIVTSSFLASEWEAFVEGTLQETKARDAQPLAGGKPTGAPPPAEDTSSDEEERHDFGEPLTRTVAQDGSRFEDEEVSRCNSELISFTRVRVTSIRQTTTMMTPIGCVQPHVTATTMISE